MTDAEKIQDAENEGVIFNLSLDDLAEKPTARIVANNLTELALQGAEIEKIHFCEKELLVIVTKDDHVYKIHFRNGKGIEFAELFPLAE